MYYSIIPSKDKTKWNIALYGFHNSPTVKVDFDTPEIANAVADAMNAAFFKGGDHVKDNMMNNLHDLLLKGVYE